MKTDAENLTALSDVQLTEQVRQGNNKAFDELMSRHTPRVKLSMKNLIHDKEMMRDAVQNVWLNVLTEIRREHYQENGQFERWLVRVAYYTALKMVNTEKHYVHGETVRTGEPYEIPPEGMDDTEKDVYDLILKMKPVMKRVVILRAIRKLTCKEIGEMMHLEVNTVTKILSRAYVMIRKKAGVLKIKNNFQASAVKYGANGIID